MERHYMVTLAIENALVNIHEVLKKETSRHYMRLYNGYISPKGEERGILMGLATTMDILCEMIWPHCYDCGKKFAIHEFSITPHDYLLDDDEIEPCICFICGANSKKISSRENNDFYMLSYHNGYPRMYTDKATKEQASSAFESQVQETKRREAKDALLSEIIELAQAGDLESIKELTVDQGVS